MTPFRAHPTIRCKTHGDLRWEGHIVCTTILEDGRLCGAAYTTRDESLSTHAPPRCRSCGERLLPVPGSAVKERSTYTARAYCPLCFTNTPRAKRGAHDMGDPKCEGETCPFHGPQIKKLQRRVQRAGSQSKSPEEPKSVEIQVPGVLGTQTFEVSRG
jgi:hypothetical protein